jgi:hypothetical protein
MLNTPGVIKPLALDSDPKKKIVPKPPNLLKAKVF